MISAVKPQVKPVAKFPTRTGANKAKGVRAGLDFLAHHSRQLAKHESVYHFVDALVEGEDTALEPISHWLTLVRSRVVRELWSHRLYVGVTVIDELLYDAVRTGEQDPVASVLRQLAGSPLLRHPGFVIYPLHSFGVLGEGIRRDFDVTRFEAFARRFGIWFTPQNNSMKRTLAFLKTAADYLEVPGPIDADLVRHWRRSRAKWLEWNPLIVVRVRELAGDYYENQRLVLDHVTIAIVLILAMSVMQLDRPEDDLGALFSTRTTTNFQTLDIPHYCVLSPSPGAGQPTPGRAVPMTLDASYLQGAVVGVDLKAAQRVFLRCFPAVVTQVQPSEQDRQVGSGDILVQQHTATG